MYHIYAQHIHGARLTDGVWESFLRMSFCCPNSALKAKSDAMNKLFNLANLQRSRPNGWCARFEVEGS